MSNANGSLYLDSVEYMYKGTADPEGSVTAPAGSFYTRTTGGDINNKFYFKGSGSGNTGWIRLVLGYDEVMILPGASDVDYDLGAQTATVIQSYHNKTVYLNNSASSGGGSDFTLPAISSVWEGYTIHFKMEQTAVGGLLRVIADGSDTMYFSGIGAFPFLDVGASPQEIALDDNESYLLEFDLVVRDATNSSFLSWGIANQTYHFKGGVTALSGATGAVTWNLLSGTHKTVTPSGNITLSISNMNEDDPELISGVIHITQGGTPYEIQLPSNSRVQTPNLFLTESGGTRTAENMSSSTEYVLTYTYDGTNYKWNISEYE